MTPIYGTPYQRHRSRWLNCTSCNLHQHRTKVVLLRGTVPCDVLFIGEGPGISEDVLGKPFVGPAGKMLDGIIYRAWLTANSKATYALTNLIACIPTDEEGTKVHTPPKEAIKACSGRLQEIISLCKPKQIVTVGSLSAQWVDKLDLKITIDKIVHPAFILRMHVASRGLEIQRCEVTLVDILEEL